MNNEIKNGNAKKVYEEILDYLLKYKQQHPDFTFLTRMQNNKNRLEEGYWFQGVNDYIFVPLYKQGDNDNKTKTIGFVVTKKGCYIEIVFKNVGNSDKRDIELHQEIIRFLQQNQYLREEKRNEKQYWFWFDNCKIENTLSFYIGEFKNFVDKLLEKYDLTDKYILSEEKFQKNLERINEFKAIATQEQFLDLEDKVSKIQNIILYGAPGVGKTYNYKKLIALLDENSSIDKIFSIIQNNEEVAFNEVEKERVAFLTFHQSYSYEDFIEGFRPNEHGVIKLQNGIFKEFCKKAKQNPTKNYYFVIDEINRGNISKIFGELITLIEEDKREVLEVVLPYSKEPFSIPKNVYIIATLNSTDKSIALIDIALRRRFIFLKMQPNEALVTNEKAKEMMHNINEFIKEHLSEDFLIGHSYFMNIEDDKELSFVLKYKIVPLLEEYFYSDKEKLEEIVDIIGAK